MVELSSAHAMRALRSMLLAVADEPMPELDTIEQHVQLVAFGAEEPVIRADEASPYLYYIVQGLVRVESTQGGRPVVLGIREEGEIIGDVATMRFRAVQRLVELDLHPRSRSVPTRGGAAAALAITTIEPTVLLRIDTRVVVDLAERHLAWSRVVLALIVVNTITRRAEFTRTHGNSPAESYAALLTERPELVRRVTQRELARLLGVSEAGMSRIAKRVHGRGA
jgi:CRP-like cAMP-binding protein